MGPAGSEGETGGRNEGTHQPDQYLHLDCRAIAEGWDLTPEQRAEVLQRLLSVCTSRFPGKGNLYKHKNREAVAAARAILAGERLQLAKKLAAGEAAGDTLASLAAEAAERAEQRRAEREGDSGRPAGAVP